MAQCDEGQACPPATDETNTLRDAVQKLMLEVMAVSDLCNRGFVESDAPRRADTDILGSIGWAMDAIGVCTKNLRCLALYFVDVRTSLGMKD